MSQGLTRPQIDQWLAQRPGWGYVDNEIRRQFQFKGFRDAIAFVVQVAELAEAAGHHPDITINYNKVLIAFTTHDAGGVTQQDLDLAARIDGLSVIS